MSAVALDDVKDHLQIKTNAHDTELAFFIDAAEAAVSRHIGPLEPTVVTRRILRRGPVTLLPDGNVIDVTGATYDDGRVIDLADAYIDAPSGLLNWLTYGDGFITVTYRVGFDPLPADLRMAVLEFVRHMWKTQRGNANVGGARGDILGVNGEPTTAAGMSSYSLPNRVKELLAPFMSTSQIA